GISILRAVEEHLVLFARLHATVALVAKLGVPVLGPPLPLLLGYPCVAARRLPVAILSRPLVQAALGLFVRYPALGLVDYVVGLGAVAVVLDQLGALTQLVRVGPVDVGRNDAGVIQSPCLGTGAAFLLQNPVFPVRLRDRVLTWHPGVAGGEDTGT